jgi:hypothetical protein
MTNFQSKTLQKTFPKIVFGTLASGAAAPPAAPAKSSATEEKLSKAAGPNGRTVAEVIAKRAELKDKTVLVRGKAVKYSADILGKNWMHLRDGSGSEKDNTNDLVVTSTNKAKVGDIVTASGVVQTGKTLGAGYSFSVLIENAKLVQ